jgi:tRNA threonylcarbamoyladenosine biosynthesis protein TsaB
MKLLLIDTALEQATISIAEDKKLIDSIKSSDQKNHASFIQQAIKDLLEGNKISTNDIDVIAVNNGPGSYTGLRVGLSTAKGLCYGLNKKLVLINTLELIAFAAIEEIRKSNNSLTDFVFVPMVDARRMEVFTAVYDASLKSIALPFAHILSAESFEKELAQSKVAFSGNGSQKASSILNNSNAIFLQQNYSPLHFLMLVNKKIEELSFANLAYSEPFYVKEFFSTQKSAASH